MNVTSSLGALAFMLSALPACAKTLVWNFDSPTGTLSFAQNYTVDGITITAFGFNASNKLTDLFGKNLGGDETGLGLANDPSGEGEIAVGQGYVQLDIRKVLSSDLVSGLALADSVTGPDMFSIFGSNTIGSLGTLLISNSTLEKTFFALPDFGKFDFYAMQATAGNVLLGAAAATTPEPGTIVLLAVTLIVGTPFVACRLCRRDSIVG